jgi:hypothetical protein
MPATLPVGCNFAGRQGGASKVTFTAGASATAHSAHGYTGTFGQYATFGGYVDANVGGFAADYTLTGDGS